MSKEHKRKWVMFCIMRVVVLYCYASIVYMSWILFERVSLTIAVAFLLTVFHVVESLMLLIKNKEYMRQASHE